MTGHYARVCRNKTNQQQPPQTTSGHNTLGVEDTDPSCFFTHQEEIKFSRRLHKTNNQAWRQRNGPSMKLDKKIIIPHMEWSDAERSFVAYRPRNLPQVSVTLSVISAAHKDFNKEIPSPVMTQIRNGISVNACADTGAQTCASGPDLLKALNIDEKYLIPTSHKIVGVTQSHMDIMGVLLVRIQAAGRESQQVVYISRNIKGFFLSEQTQIDLGILSPQYPAPGVFSTEESITAATTTYRSSETQGGCTCMRRTKPPLKPEQIPFPPTPENRERLETWILDRYGASAFNTCEHQPLPKMNAKPLSIHFRPDAQAKAFHCPIPVPHYWKKDVKSDLDRDVRLKIIEPVPPGTPTVWCSKMVVVPKKDGSPRRTVNLQQLNEATYRETHHTPSPFNQASVVPPHKKKTVLDAWNGYHSLGLSPDASNATTFITEWGRYRYLSSPQGFHAAGDGYTKAFDDITIDYNRKAKCIDDTLLWDDNLESAF